MKKLLTVLVLVVGLSAKAQNTDISPVVSGTVFGKIMEFLATNPEVGTATNWSFVAYASHAKGLLDSKGENAEWGGGIAALYPLNDYIRTGVRLQYFASDWFMPSVNVQLQSSYKLFGTAAVFTPIAFTGIASPVGGSPENGTVGTLFGAGASVVYPISSHWDVGAGYAIETWSNLKVDKVEHFGLVLKYKW